jgi:hypothetical protein
MYLVIVTGDFNDADYVESHYVLDDKEYGKFLDGLDLFLRITKFAARQSKKYHHQSDVVNLLYKELRRNNQQELLSSFTTNAKELALNFWENYTPYYDDGIDGKPHTIVKVEAVEFNNEISTVYTHKRIEI